MLPHRLVKTSHMRSLNNHQMAPSAEKSLRLCCLYNLRVLTIYTSVDPVLPMVVLNYFTSVLIYTTHDCLPGLSWTSDIYEAQLFNLWSYIFKFTLLSFFLKLFKPVGLYF